MLKLYYFHEDDVELEMGVNTYGELYLCKKVLVILWKIQNKICQ